MSKKNDKSDNVFIFPLTNYWWEKVQNGTKTNFENNDGKWVIEYRLATGKYKSQFINLFKKLGLKTAQEAFERIQRFGTMPYCNVDLKDFNNIYGVFQKGYSQDRVGGRITKISVVNGKDTDLAVDEYVFVIWIEDPKDCYLRYYPKVYDKTGDYYIEETTEGYEYLEYYYWPCEKIEDAISFGSIQKAKDADYWLGNDCTHDYDNMRYYLEKHFYQSKED